jgi:Type VI secretion system (T6SS), amidase effector protein 4
MDGTLPAAQAKHQAHARMPVFDLLLANYPRDRSGGNVKRLIGGGVNDTGKPLRDQWLGGENGDTCTIRISRALNYSGLHIPASFHGLRTTRGSDGFHYAFAVQEMRVFLTSTLGQPQINVSRKPISREPFKQQKGIILFDINFGLNPDGRTRALGHVDLWDGETFFDEVFGISSPRRDFFQIATRVSLWVANGRAVIPI